MLTKSDILSMRQCTRKLWLEKKRPDLVPDANSSQDRRAVDGHMVNEAARRAIGSNFIWPAGETDKTEGMKKALAQLAASPATPVVEMPLVHEGLYVRLDALLPGTDGYILQETKSSTFPLKTDKVTPGRPDDNYLDDVAIQTWVAEGAGIKLERSELNLLNSRWTYLGDDDYSGLFRPMDVTDMLEERKAAVPIWLAQARDIVDAESMPEKVTGSQCKKPHDCSFKGFCVKLDPPGPEHPIELLPDSAGKGLAKKLKAEKGYTSLLEPDVSEFVGAAADLYVRIQRAHREGKSVLEAGADKIMSALSYPRYYFDFEGIDLPVPRWAGVRPYEQIAFQWSCHIERAPGVFEAHSFLDVSGDDPTLACIKRMQEVINPDDGGPILVYYQTYEKGRMEGMIARYPEYEELISKYIARLFDLHPMVKKHFYDPRMQGSFSIKKVLPVIAPDLDYKELQEVQEGTGAQIAYLGLAFDKESMESERWERLKTNALLYCDQDTWAMVEAGYFLEGKTRPKGIRPAPAL